MPKHVMAKASSATIPDAGVEAEIDRVCARSIDQLRDLYRRTFRSAPPKALTKDLIARMITWRIQEQAYGGFDRATLKLLDEYARGKGTGAKCGRRLKAGAVLVREYQNERHTVTVTPDGFVWREQTYQSLSGIARAITGMSWNGPRFFGLRTGGHSAKADPASQKKAPTPAAKRGESAKARIRAQAQSDPERALP
jgi:hypothetical protein